MDLETMEALYRYNTWAHERVLRAVSRVSQEAFTRDLKSSYGSIRDTLTHVVWSEWVWLQRWKGTSPKTLFSPADYPDVASLRERLESVTAERIAFMDGLTADGLQRVVEYTNVTGTVWGYPLWQQLYHVVNHSTYHRGQVAAMLRQVGAVPEETDFLVYYDYDGS